MNKLIQMELIKWLKNFICCFRIQNIIQNNLLKVIMHIRRKLKNLK